MWQIEHILNNKNKHHKLDLESEDIYIFIYVVICNPLITQRASLPLQPPEQHASLSQSTTRRQGYSLTYIRPLLMLKHLNLKPKKTLNIALHMHCTAYN